MWPDQLTDSGHWQWLTILPCKTRYMADWEAASKGPFHRQYQQKEKSGGDQNDCGDSGRRDRIRIAKEEKEKSCDIANDGL